MPPSRKAADPQATELPVRAEEPSAEAWLAPELDAKALMADWKSADAAEARDGPPALRPGGAREPSLFWPAAEPARQP